MTETYTPGYTANATALMARRRLDSHGAFLTQYLRPGLRVLDVGCGPGSITLDIASEVAPGHVVGLDQEPSQVELAWGAARDAGVGNVSFERGSVYALPFADGSFDIVFAHAVFEHLADPRTALSEIQRVLVAGGRVALRSPDWGGFVVAPSNAKTEAAIATYRALQERNGGNVHAGRQLGASLRAAGFTDVVVSAAYEIYPSAELIGEYLARQLEVVGDTMSASTLRRWMVDPDALFAQAWFEAVGTRS